VGFAFACLFRLVQGLDLYEEALALTGFLCCLITISCMIEMEICVLRFFSPILLFFELLHSYTFF
jgi:hypothetical protein